MIKQYLSILISKITHKNIITLSFIIYYFFTSLFFYWFICFVNMFPYWSHTKNIKNSKFNVIVSYNETTKALQIMNCKLM